MEQARQKKFKVKVLKDNAKGQSSDILNVRTILYHDGLWFSFVPQVTQVT